MKWWSDGRLEGQGAEGDASKQSCTSMGAKSQERSAGRTRKLDEVAGDVAVLGSAPALCVWVSLLDQIDPRRARQHTRRRAERGRRACHRWS